MIGQYSDTQSSQQMTLPYWRKKQDRRKLGLKVLLGIMAVGACLPGMASAANDITAAAGATFTSVANNTDKSVTTVTTTKIIPSALNSTAVNVFDTYAVGKGNVANMYFGTTAKNDAKNLVNFVKNRVDINGVVNAIQNKKIGGNIYFLSSDGIAVSNTGVINAGSVTLMTPTQGEMANIAGDKTHDVPLGTLGTNYDNMILKFVDPNQAASIPLNPSGTITVDGQIHATDGITLRSGFGIVIGTENNTNAVLETGITDFSSFVNTDSASAGLGTLVAATKTGNGDIILTASNSEKNIHDASFHQSFMKAIGSTDANTIKTAVEQNSGTIRAAGDVCVTAESTNNDERVAQTVAIVNITGGTIQGTHVAVKADAKNTFSDNGSLDTVVDAPLKILGTVTANFDADYALLDSQAAVNIGSKAVLTATGENTTDAAGNIIEKAMDIQANSLLGSKMGAATTPFKFADIKFSNIAPAAAVTYFDGSNNASVQIDGTLKTTKAAGDASVAATATTEIAADASTTTTTLAGNASLFNAALLVLHASNTANVNIGSAAQLQGDNLKGKLDISSTANNGLTATVSTKGSDSSAAASAVNITTYDSSSAVDVAAGVKAADVTINANNNVIRNTVMTKNAIGATALMKTVTNKLTNSETFGSLFGTSSGSTSLANHIINLLPTKLATIIHTPADKNSLGEQAAQFGKMISVGVGVQYVDESNTSQVKVHAVPVTADSGNVTIKAKTDVQDTRMVVAGAANNQQDNSQVQYTADGAVLIAGMDNTSQVVIDGGTTASHAAITGKNVTISADTQMPYNRVNKLIEGVTDAVAAVKEAYKDSNFADNSEYMKALDDIDATGKALVSMEGSFSDKLSNAGTALSDFSNAVGSLLNIVGNDTSAIGDTVAAPIAVLKNAVQFTSTDQYANFYVRTVASEGQADQDSKLALAGSVSVTDVTNDSRVLIGKNAVVTATDALKTTAAAKAENVSFTGNASALLLPGSANATGVGASVAVQRFSSDSLVLAAEGAKLTGAAVDVEANTTLTPTGVVLSAGKAGENGLSGMINIMSGSGSAIASVDDEAVLTAKKASAGTITEKQNDGSVTIKATNDTTLTNISGGFMKASGTSVGVGVAVNNYGVDTIAGVFDNDADANVTEDTAASTVTAKAANKKKAASKLALSMSGLDDTAKAALLGSSSMTAAGLLTGQSVAADATTSGVINSVGIAGAVSTSDDSGKEGVGAKIGKFVSGISDKITTPIGNGMTKVDGFMSGKLNSHGFSPAKLANSGSSNQKKADAKANSLSDSSSPKVSIAGSVAINMLDGQSSAMLDQANVTLQPDPGGKASGSLTTKATDTLFSGAWAGAAAVNWATTTKPENSSTSVGVSGAAAVNVIDRDVDSIISNSTIKHAGSIINSASKDGAEVAAALGMTLSKSTGSEAGANVAVAAAVSYNNIDSDVHALMIDDTVSTDNGAVTALQNDAYNGDIQVTGGVNAALSFGGQSGAGVGASVVIGTITDDVQSVISGGTYTQMGNVDVTSALATKQIGVGVGVAASSSSNSGTFEGVVAYNAVSNTANAAIDGASITTAGDQTVTVKTYDTNSSANSHAQYIKDRGLDADGASYEAALDNKHDYTDDEKDQNYNKAVAGSAAKTDENGGNVIVTGALSVSGSSGKAAIGAGVAIDEITNDFTSNITNSTITAGAVKGTADADTVLVGFSVGAAGSSNFGGAGSVSWQDLDSSAVTTVMDSAITANTAKFTATNDTVGVNVAGQVSAGKVATGLAMAYHGLDNTTGAYVYGSDLKARDASDGIAVTLDAESTARIYSVGVGVGVSTSTAAVNGVVTMNRGSNTTEAVIDSDSKGKRTTITDANDVKTTAKDDTVTVAIAGGVTAGSGSAVGGAVAINDIGGFSNDGTKSSQNIKSQINHTDITSFTPATGAADQINLISTDASDNAHMVTVGAGIGASSQVAVQGAAASSLINKNVVSGLDDTDIDASTVDASTAKISTTAANEAHVVASAVVIAGSGTAAIGAGVGVNRIVQNTEASVTGGTQHVANASLNSTSNPDILAIGVGGAGAGTASVAGSFGINMIQNDTKALISGATMVSQQNIGVVAQSDEYIDNIVGAVSGSGTAAIGLSTAVNTINGTTAAIVDNSDLTAKGSDEDAISTDSDMKDGSVLTSFVDKGAFVPGTLKAGRQSATKTGLAVDSSSTHSILSTVFSAGGSGVAAVLGTANVNDIGGATTAQILDSNVNKNLTATDKADVTVKAADYTNEAGFTGTAGGSGTATVGAASDTNILERTVQASVENDKKNTAIQKNMIHASDFTVDAVAQQGLSSFDTGVGIAGEGAAVVGNVSVAKLDGTTAALVDNSDITSDSTRVAADHKANIFVGGVNVTGAAIGAAVGAAVAVTNSTGTTSAEMKDSTDVSTGDVTVKAKDKTILNTIMTSGAISGAGVSVLGNTSVNNIHNIVTAKTTDSTITGKDVLVQADNSVQTENIGGVLSVGGLGGAGVSVSVNTFDSTVGAVVSGGSLTASDGDVTVKANDTRDVDQTVVNVAGGAVGASANIMVTTAGTKVDNTDATDKIDTANKNANDKKDAQAGILGLTDTEKQKVQENRTTETSYGGDVLNAGISAKVTGSKLTAEKGTVSVNTEEKNDITMHGGSAAVGGVSLNGSVGILKLNHNAQTSLDAATVTAKDVSLTSSLVDKNSGSTLNLYQGSMGGITLAAAYGQVTVDGASAVYVNDSTITAQTGNIDITANDTSTAAVNAYGLSGGVAVAGAIVANADNSSTTAIILDNNTIESAKGTITASASKANTATSAAYSGAIGAADLNAAAAIAKDSGTSSVALTNTKGANSLKGKTISLTASNTPAVKAIAGSGTLSLIFSGGASIATATASGKATIGIADKTALLGDTVTVKGNIGGKDSDTPNAYASVVGIGGSVGASVDVNLAEADNLMDALVTVGDSVYKTETENGVTTGVTVLSIEAENNTQATTDAKGLTIGGAFASGTNKVKTVNKSNAEVSLSGAAAGQTQVQSLTVKATGSSTNTGNARGDGGAIVAISPLAAVADNDTNGTATIDVSGGWNVADTVDVQATQRFATALTTDTLTATIIGGSGAASSNSVAGTTEVNLQYANITSDGAQHYLAQNTLAIKNNVEASGYGAGDVTASSQDSKFKFTANVNMTGSTLHNTGDASTGTSNSITAQALTKGDITNENTIKSAGVVAGTFASSGSDTSYDNNINLTQSTLTTDTTADDILLAASDNTNVNLSVVADTQGGAVGASSADNTSKFDRSNKVTVDENSRLFSTHDIGLYAGVDGSDNKSTLDYNIGADAYNKTGIPLATVPSISNTMTQSNQVVLGGNAESVRHINLKAGKGIATVAESAKEYKWLGGESGHGNLASTVLGDTIKNQTTDNHVTISGSATAGIHNALEISLSGAVSSKENPSNPNAPLLDTSDFTLTLGSGSEWFKKTDWYKANVDASGHVTVSQYDLVNNLVGRYNEVVKLMEEYAPGTDAHTYYQAEIQRLGSLLDESGFASPIKNESGAIIGYSVDENRPLPAIILGKLAASGGNINIDSDAVDGAGTLTAKGNPSLSVTNSSDAYLVIKGAEISDAGGSVNYNDASYKQDLFGSDFTGTVHQDTDNGQKADISIHGTTAANTNSKFNIQADIGILGNVINNAGNVSITNDNYDIMVDGAATVSGNTVSIAAPKGAVTQSSPTGVINVGGDPIEQYAMQESIMAKVQKTMGTHSTGEWAKTFSSWLAYAKWVKSQNSLLFGAGTLNGFGLSLEEQAYIDALIAASTTTNNPGGIVAGGNIYINGADVNINGLVQSGFDKYTAVLTDAETAKIATLDKNYDGRTLTDRDILSNLAYRIHGATADSVSNANQGEKVSNIVYDSSKGAYDYDVSLYYNPQTKQIITDTINVKGGKIYITGAISSTGNGKIRAANGTADINIDTTASNRDVLVNTISNKNISGFISITDTNRKDTVNHMPLVTEYTDGSALSYWQGDAAKTPVTTYGNTASIYDVTNDLSYNWTGGAKSTVVEKWEYQKDFIAWGLIKYGQTKDLEVAANADAQNTSKVVTTTDGAALTNGFVIAGGSTLGSNAFSITTNTSANTEAEAKYSDVVVSKDYDGFWGTVLGYGTAYYDWTKTYGTTTDVIYRINASRDVGVGFLNSGTDKISVATGGSLLMNDSISNAGTAGTTTLSSQTGAVVRVAGNPGSVVTDHLTTTADKGIDLYHQSISGTSNVDLSTTSGNIAFVSKKGDINLQQAVTGGTDAITASTGTVDVSTEGSILNGNTAADYIVKGRRIDLSSQTGSIGTKAAALTIQGGSDMYTADSMDASVNATAQGDIVLTQSSGNMRLGEVKSYGGDAVLTVLDGSFADALRDTENSDPTAVNDKIKQWQDLGLISKLDADDTSTNAGTDAKTLRLDALTVQANALAVKGKVEDANAYIQKLKDEATALAADSTVSTLRQAYLKDASSGTSSSTADALAAYQKAQNDYFNAKGYTAAEKDWITSWSEVNGADNYGWSKNQLLYAIQDSIINSKPGVVPFVKTPNVKANNITLNAAKGGVGIDQDAKDIAYADADKLANLKILAAAKGGDLTWDDTKRVVTVRQQQPINVELNTVKGLLNVTGQDNVYLAGTEKSTFNINNIVTDGDIKLMSQAGINAVNDTGTTLTGVNLIIQGGTGSIGSSDHMITTDLSGTIDANSGDSIYLDQVSDKDLIIQGVAAGKDIYLGAVNNILMSQETGKNMGYINSTAGSITLNSAKGSLGLADDAIRILGTGAPVNASAYDIYLDGKGTGNLVLGTIDAGASLQVTSENGTVSVGTDTLTGHVKAQADSLITSYGDINLNGDIVIGNDKNPKKLDLTSKNGSVIQTTDNPANGITVDTLGVTTYGGQSLANVGNAFNTFDMNGMAQATIHGDVDVKTNAPKGLTAKLNDSSVIGHVNITNLSQDSDAGITLEGGVKTIDDTAHPGTVDGDVNVNAAGTIVNDGPITSIGTILFQSTAGAIVNKDVVNAKHDVDLTAHTDISNTGAVEATDGHVNMTAETGKITNGNAVTAGTDVVMNAGNGIDNSGSVTAAAGNVGMTTKDGNINNSGAVQAETSVMMKDGTGNIINSGAVTANNGPVGMTAAAGAIDNQATVSAKGDVDLTAHTDISNTGAVESTDGHVNMTAETGKITSGGTVTGNGDVVMQAQTDITNSGAVTSQQGMVDMAAKTGKITNGQDVTAATDVIMDAESGIDNSGSVTAKTRKISMTVKNGNIANTGDVQAGTSVTMEDGTGNILNDGNVNAGTEAKLQTTTGDIINKGKLLAGTDVTATTENGKVQSLGDVTAATGNVLLKAKTGRVEVGSAAGDATVTAGNTATLATDSTTKSDIEIYGDIVGTNGISLTTNVGDIIWHGRGTAVQGPVQVTTNTGNIDHTGAIAAGTDVLQQTQTGNITNGGTIDAGGNVTQQTQTGNITNGGTIDAGGNVTQQTQTGSITDNGDIQAGNDALLQTGSGDIGINGNILANRNVTIHADSGNITAAEGTIIAAANGNAEVSSGKGDITLHELRALKEAGVDANDGNVKVFRIEGEDILIAVRNPEKSADIGSISLKNKLTFIGQALDLGEMEQQPGPTTMLELSPRGANDALPMDHLNIGNVITPNGLHVDQLWAKNSDIHVSSPKFYIDKLGILDVAHLSNSDTNTTVWGSAPVRDSANTIYWYGPQRHDPWMNLYFTDRQHTQFSNGVLLRYDDYYYAKNDRFSGVNIAFKREDRSEHAYRQVEDFHGEAMPGFFYGMYDRYGLIEADKDVIPEAPKADIVIDK
jgi:hypothetical protein